MKTNVQIHHLIRTVAISMLTGLAIPAPHALGAVHFSQLNTDRLIASTAVDEILFPGLACGEKPCLTDLAPAPHRSHRDAPFADDAPLSCHLQHWAELLRSHPADDFASMPFAPWSSDNGVEVPELPFLETMELPPTDFPVSLKEHYAAVSFPDDAVLGRN